LRGYENCLRGNFGRLVRDEDVQVLHGFDTEQNANAYLQSPLFTRVCLSL